MPFNFITLWKSEMKLKSFINCKSTYILSQYCLLMLPTIVELHEINLRKIPSVLLVRFVCLTIHFPAPPPLVN